MGFQNHFKKINKQLLPVKVHYFLFFAALACALPFRTIFAKQLGLSATAVGVIFFAVPFMRILSNPLVGVILDYFKRFRLTISVIMLIVTVSHIAMVFIPAKAAATLHNVSDNNFYSKVQYYCENKTQHHILFLSDYNGTTLEKEKKFRCVMQCSTSIPSTKCRKSCGEHLSLEFMADVNVLDCNMDVQILEGKIVNDKKKMSKSAINTNDSFVSFHLLHRVASGYGCPKGQTIARPLTVNKISEDGNNTIENVHKESLDFEYIAHAGKSRNLDTGNQALSTLHKLTINPEATDWFSNCPSEVDLDCKTKICFTDSPQHEKDFASYEIKIEPGENEYVSVQFWALFILITISSQTLSAIMFMMDTVCYEMLQDKKEKYGQQRLWGTVGWGIGALAGGYLNDIFSSDSDKIDYAPSFYLLAIISLLDLFPIYQLKVTDVKYSTHIWKDVCQLLSKLHILYSIVMIYFIGVLSGFIWNYQFWFMEEIGASQVLLGLSQTFEGLFEVPWFIVSGWIIRKVGHDNSNSIALVSFGLRFLCFALMFDPWMTIPVALLHGPTFGLFYASLTMYAKREAPPGTEATVQSLIHLSFEGVGAATGVILGGIGFDRFGSRTTFVIAARLSFLLLAVNLILTAAFYRFRRKNKSVDIIDNPKDDGEKSTEDKH